jgi:hypothetical protein
MANLTGFKRDNTSAYIEKHPDANIQYGVDWTDYLNSGDSVSTATITIQSISGDSSPLKFPTAGYANQQVRTSAGEDVSISANVVNIRLTNGTLDNIYTVDVKITTSDGDTDSRRFRIKITNKVL